jgi:hypothetical protein
VQTGGGCGNATVVGAANEALIFSQQPRRVSLSSALAIDESPRRHCGQRAVSFKMSASEPSLLCFARLTVEWQMWNFSEKIVFCGNKKAALIL